MDAKSPVEPGASEHLFAEDSRYGYLIVASAFVLMSIIWTSFYTFGIFFKPVLKDFGWTRALTAGAFSLNSVIQGLLSVAMGGLTDRFGPRIVMTVCGVLLAAGYLLMSQIDSLWQLYIFYSLIVGFGMGGSFAPLMTLTARWFVRKRGMMTGIVACGTGAGALIGPPVAGVLISSYGWRASYAIMGVVVLISMVLISQVLKSAPGHVMKRTYNSDGQENKGHAIHGEGATFHDAAVSVKFWAVFTMICCLGFCVFIVMVHMPPHITDLGLTQGTAAGIMAAIGAVSVAGRLVFGKVLDKIGSRMGFIIGFGTMVLSFCVLLFADTLGMLYLFAAIFGFAFAACVTCESPLVADLFGLRSHGLLLGIVAGGFDLGGAVGPFLAGYIFDITGKYQAAFILCGITSLIGLLLARFLRRQATTA